MLKIREHFGKISFISFPFDYLVDHCYLFGCLQKFSLIYWNLSCRQEILFKTRRNGKLGILNKDLTNA